MYNYRKVIKFDFCGTMNYYRTVYQSLVSLQQEIYSIQYIIYIVLSIQYIVREKERERQEIQRQPNPPPPGYCCQGRWPRPLRHLSSQCPQFIQFSSTLLSIIYGELHIEVLAAATSTRNGRVHCLRVSKQTHTVCEKKDGD